MADAALDAASYDAGYEAGYRDALAHMVQHIGGLFTCAAHVVKEGQRFQSALRQTEATLQARWAEVPPRRGGAAAEPAPARKPRRSREASAPAAVPSPPLDWSGPNEIPSEPPRAPNEEAERAVARAWRA